MLARVILGSGRTCGVSFRHFRDSSGWWWLISSMFLIRISCRKTTHANCYYGAWPGWAVSISVLPPTTRHIVIFKKKKKTDPHLWGSSLTTPFLLGHPRFPSQLGPWCRSRIHGLHTWVQVWYLHMKTHPSFHQSEHLQGRDSSWPEAADGLSQGPWAACLFCPQECKAFPLGAFAMLGGDHSETILLLFPF